MPRACIRHKTLGYIDLCGPTWWGPNSRTANVLHGCAQFLRGPSPRLPDGTHRVTAPSRRTGAGDDVSDPPAPGAPPG
jgi:hypothetical protein